MATHRIHALQAGALALAASLLVACSGTRTLMDPILEIRTSAGQELGVSTDFGVLFLGRSARAGEVLVTAWYGDGPSVEPSVIEPLGDGLYTAEVQIRLPTTPLSFQNPEPGERLIVAGRRGSETWEEEVEVLSHARVQGILISVPGRLRNAPDQVGAAVFVERGDEEQRLLLGLVAGRLEMTAADGSVSEYLTVIGPDHLWRLVTRKQDLLYRKRWIYREDIL